MPNASRHRMSGIERLQRVRLDRAMPVYVLYTTAVIGDEGQLRFYDDIYGHDARLQRALDSRYLRN